MSKIGFDPEPLGVVSGTHYGYVGGPASGCAFRPIVSRKVGIEAIVEGLRLADIECVISTESGGTGPAKDIDP